MKWLSEDETTRVRREKSYIATSLIQVVNNKDGRARKPQAEISLSKDAMSDLRWRAHDTVDIGIDDDVISIRRITNGPRTLSPSSCKQKKSAEQAGMEVPCSIRTSSEWIVIAFCKRSYSKDDCIINDGELSFIRPDKMEGAA